MSQQTDILDAHAGSCSFSLECGDIPASVAISRFQGQSGVEEYELIVRPTEHERSEIQLDWIFRAYRSALESLGLEMSSAVLRRFFCDDILNQSSVLAGVPFSRRGNASEPCAVSWVRQPPIAPEKISLWAYHVSDPNSELDITQGPTSFTLKRGPLSHHWTTGLTCPNTHTSHGQTQGILEKYDAYLRARNMSLANNVIRTWFFVRHIDSNYQGLVDARREFFAERGLTPNTHFIASTGIEGESADPDAKVAMDAYAISGVRPEQIEYLEALDHLSPTHLYGVTFERATSVAYRDRKHIFISGTASIDRSGNILHPGNVSRQLDRTIENIEALLEQAGAALADMCTFLVYIRNASDHEVAWQKMRERFGDTPIEVVVAPVCRPGWLIEVEGKAIVPEHNPEAPAF